MSVEANDDRRKPGQRLRGFNQGDSLGLQLGMGWMRDVLLLSVHSLHRGWMRDVLLPALVPYMKVYLSLASQQLSPVFSSSVS